MVFWILGRSWVMRMVINESNVLLTFVKCCSVKGSHNISWLCPRVHCSHFSLWECMTMLIFLLTQETLLAQFYLKVRSFVMTFLSVLNVPSSQFVFPIFWYWLLLDNRSLRMGRKDWTESTGVRTRPKLKSKFEIENWIHDQFERL